MYAKNPQRPCWREFSRISSRRSPTLAVSRPPSFSQEPSDNIGGGAPGDGVDLLVHSSVQASKTPRSPSTIRRPSPALAAARLGDRRALSIGGAAAPSEAGHSRRNFEFVSRSDGRFALEDPHSHFGLHVRQQVRHGAVCHSPPIEESRFCSPATRHRRSTSAMAQPGNRTRKAVGESPSRPPSRTAASTTRSPARIIQSRLPARVRAT